MGLDLIHGRVSSSKREESDSFAVSELEAPIVDWFRSYVQTQYDQQATYEVLHYATLYHQTRSSVLKTMYESIANDSFFVRQSELAVLLAHLKPEVRSEFQQRVIESFVEGTDFVLVEW
jgi:hypothetical protein